MVAEPVRSKEDWNSKTLASLTEHIVQTHHVFCRQETTRIAALLKDAIAQSGEAHPELKRIHDLFYQMSRDLNMHLLKEEETLFPYILKVEKDLAKGDPISWPPFGTVENPIRIMIVEHVKTDDELGQIRKLSNDYTAPADASESYSELYRRLALFDQDMQRHIECENDLLFPRAVAMEEEACARQKASNG